MKKLDSIQEQNEEVVFRCKTVWPFDFFPTEIEVTQSRLNIKQGTFFFSYRSTLIFIEDILHTQIHKTPFFSTFSVELIRYEDNPNPVRYLRPSDAEKLEEYITGLIATKKKEVELDPDSGAKKKVRKIGETQTF